MREVWRFKILGCRTKKTLNLLDVSIKLKHCRRHITTLPYVLCHVKTHQKKIKENQANFHARTRYVFIMEEFGPPENTNFYIFHVLNVLKR